MRIAQDTAGKTVRIVSQRFHAFGDIDTSPAVCVPLEAK